MNKIMLKTRMSILVAVTLLAAACTTDSQNKGPSGTPINEGQRGYGTPGVTSSDLGDVEVGSLEELEATAGTRIYFGYDRYDLSPRARDTLQKQALWLRKYTDKEIVIEGHCDERGTREYNLALGARRAAAAKRYLVNMGVDPSRIGTISYGKEMPENASSTESAWARNRRDVTTIVQ